MPGSRFRRGKPSKEQVRAWLGTVLAPIIDALRVEQDRVARADWSFRSRTRDFEYLCPVPMMVSPVYLPNLEQLWRYVPDLSRTCAVHDERLASLLSACRDAFEHLLASEAFERLPRSGEFEQLAQTLPMDAVSRTYIAEYVVNGLEELPSHYVYARAWSTLGRAFLDLRKDATLSRSFTVVSQAGTAFGEAVDRLYDEARKVQRSLADEFALPAVDPAQLHAH